MKEGKKANEEDDEKTKKDNSVGEKTKKCMPLFPQNTRLVASVRLRAAGHGSVEESGAGRTFDEGAATFSAKERKIDGCVRGRAR